MYPVLVSAEAKYRVCVDCRACIFRLRGRYIYVVECPRLRDINIDYCKTINFRGINSHLMKMT